MMLNMDLPGQFPAAAAAGQVVHPARVARLDERIRGHARTLCDRPFAGRRGECDFAKDVAADLPLLALADVLGMPEQDRWLLFDWSNWVIGYQDPDYASSADFDPSGGTPMAAEAVALRPAGPGRPHARSRTRDGMPDLYAYAHLLADAKRRRPGDDVMSILLAQVDDDGGRVSVEEFENMFWLFAVAGNETLRNGLPGACIALLEHPRVQDELRADPGLMPRAVEEMLRWWTPVYDVPPDHDRRLRARRAADPRGGQGGGLLHLGQPRRGGLRRARPVRHPAASQPAPGLRARAAFLPRLPPGPRPDARAVRRGARRTSALAFAGEPSYLRSNFQRGVKRLPIAWAARTSSSDPGRDQLSPSGTAHPGATPVPSRV